MSGSAFHDPSRYVKKRYRGLLLVAPPTAHVAAYVTGGLRDTYGNIRKKKIRTVHEFGTYTDTNGHFSPKAEMPLLALRYRYLETLGKGQSSVIIKATDSFRKDHVVSIKVLHTTYFPIGSQEADIMLEINQDDPFAYVPIVKLLNVFSFDDHYCLTFDLLNPEPITDHFKQLGISKEQSLPVIRDVTLKLLSVTGFLSRVNILHADLKPDNILLGSGKDLSGLKVVDFGNAIRCIHDELSLYYTDYELQTLIYRAPEVTVGLHFGLAVDMWSIGCIIAELYFGQPLFLGRNKEEVLEKVTQILGPLPQEFQKGMFYPQFKQFVGHPFTKFEAIRRLNKALGGCSDWAFVDFVFNLLTYRPKDRMTPWSAACHPFLASVVPCLYLTPGAGDNSGKLYPSVMIEKNAYPFEVDRSAMELRCIPSTSVSSDELNIWREPYGQETPPSTSPERNIEEESWTESSATSSTSQEGISLLPAADTSTVAETRSVSGVKKKTRRRSASREKVDKPSVPTAEHCSSSSDFKKVNTEVITVKGKYKIKRKKMSASKDVSSYNDLSSSDDESTACEPNKDRNSRMVVCELNIPYTSKMAAAVGTSKSEKVRKISRSGSSHNVKVTPADSLDRFSAASDTKIASNVSSTRKTERAEVAAVSHKKMCTNQEPWCSKKRDLVSHTSQFELANCIVVTDLHEKDCGDTCTNLSAEGCVKHKPTSSADCSEDGAATHKNEQICASQGYHEHVTRPESDEKTKVNDSFESPAFRSHPEDTAVQDTMSADSNEDGDDEEEVVYLVDY